MSSLLALLQTFVSNPANTVPMGLLAVAFLAVYLIFFTTRDILLRTNSFLYQCFCILLVAVLPGVGFLLYLLIRPSRTLAQAQNHQQLHDIWTLLHSDDLPLEESTEFSLVEEDGDQVGESEDVADAADDIDDNVEKEMGI